MGRKRERPSGFGLLQRMEARPHKDGKSNQRSSIGAGFKPIRGNKSKFST